MKKHRNLIVDLTNIARTKRHTLKDFKRRGNMENEFIDSFIADKSIIEILQVAKTARSDSIIIVEDSKNLWRKDVYPDYKNKEQKEDELNNEVFEAMGMIVNFFKNFTAAGHLKVNRCEADEIMWGCCEFSGPNVHNDILTSDKDMMQVIGDNARVFNPLFNSRGWRKFDHDLGAGFFLFEKIIRGDTNDNIPSAYPRVQRKKLISAWNDDSCFGLQQILEHILPDGEKVEKYFNFNRSLIDLSETPEVYQNDIKYAMANMTHGKYKHSLALQELTSLGMSELLKDMLFDSARTLSTKPVL